MKALRTIGLKKAIRFIFFSFYDILLHFCIIPQFRVILLRLAGAKIGANTIVFNVKFFNLYHYGFKKLSIGKNCFIGDEVMLDMRGEIKLEDDVTLSNRCNIITHINVGYPDHPLQKFYPTYEGKVIIKKGSYIATGAIILPDVVIGEKSVVAAGAVVTKDVRHKTVVAGVPAKMIKRL